MKHLVLGLGLLLLACHPSAISDGGTLPDGGPAHHDDGGTDAGTDAGIPETSLPLLDDGGLPHGVSTVTLNVDVTQLQSPVNPEQAGVNHRFEDRSYGMWTDAGADPTAVEETRQTGLGLLRYPGGTEANMFRLASSVGATRGCEVFATREQNDQNDWVWASAPQTTTVYGPAEHMRFVEQLGIATDMQLPFMNSSPSDAADWVEYFNADAGTNPNGGIAWADIRAANGHPAPYGIRHWEIGNEPYYAGQRYWLTLASSSAAAAQYIDGEHSQTFVDQPLGKACDLRDAASVSDGSANQVFQIWYPPVTHVAVKVDGTAWTKVSSLASAAAGDTVFTLDNQTGDVTFGDGTHGKVPPNGKTLSVSYQLDHAGFPEFVTAMKAVDPSIQVCSAWGRSEFVDGMHTRGLGYDCVIDHPYTIFQTSYGTADAFYDAHMAGEEEQGAEVKDLIAAVKDGTSGKSFVAFTEYGAIAGGNTEPIPNFEATEMHAMYMASVMARVLNQNIHFAQGGPLTSAGTRSTLSNFGGTWVSSAHARVLESFSTLLHGGGSTLVHSFDANPTEGAGSDTYPALIGGAVLDGSGHLSLWVVNRAMTDRLTLQVSAPGFSGHGDGTAWVVDSSDGSYTAVNTPNKPGAVALTKWRVSSTNKLKYTLPPHSVTWLRLDP